jgi:tRNA nucleotidyltransferase (CCA-adding enzyme)
MAEKLESPWDGLSEALASHASNPVWFSLAAKRCVAIISLCYIIRVQAMPEVMNYQKSDLARTLSSQQLSLLRMVADMAAIRRLPLYLVGGFVRDLLLGCPAADFDLVVEGDAISFARALAAQYGGKVTAHLPFGTAQWFPPISDRHALDFISTRSETYKHTAALPTVSPGTLTDDLVRRDFTINTLALRLDGEHWGELRDDLGGLNDLKRGLVRVLHPESFQDDPTRLFRAARYEQRYGFQIAPETASLMPQAHPLIGALSAERVRHELDRMLEEEKAAAMLSRLAELDLLQPVHPSLMWNNTMQERFLNALRLLPEYPLKLNQTSAGTSFLGWHFWLMGVASIDLESLNRRLHFRAKLFDSLLAASTLSVDMPSLIGSKPSRWVRRLENLPLTAVYAVLLTTSVGKARQNLHKYLETWRHVKPKTNGYDLMKRGLPPGPRFQQVLQRLREAWLDEEVKTNDEEMKLLDSMTNLPNADN